jgi:hypothetical protein
MCCVAYCIFQLKDFDRDLELLVIIWSFIAETIELSHVPCSNGSRVVGRHTNTVTVVHVHAAFVFDEKKHVTVLLTHLGADPRAQSPALSGRTIRDASSTAHFALAPLSRLVRPRKIEMTLPDSG